jgi:uncharacterized protein (TIRG00374 family)
VSALEWSSVVESLTQADRLWIGLGVISVLVTIAARLARWSALLYPRRLRSKSLLSAMLVGQLLNYFAPARAGDLVRAYLIGDTEGVSAVWALGTIAVEKLWDLGALLALLGLLSFSQTLPGWLIAPARGLGFLTLLALLGSLLLLRYRATGLTWIARLDHVLPAMLRGRLQQVAEQLLEGLAGLQQPRVWFWAAIWSAATWGIGSYTNHTVLRAFGLSLPLSAAVMLMVVLQLGVAVPSLPGRVGLYEGLCILVLAVFSVDADTAFAVGLVLHAVSFVPPIILGLYFAWRIKGFDRLVAQDRTGLGV